MTIPTYTKISEQSETVARKGFVATGLDGDNNNKKFDLGDICECKGVALPATYPGTLDGKCLYNASTVGVYTYFHDSSGYPIEITEEGSYNLIWDLTSWSLEKIYSGADSQSGVFDLDIINPKSSGYYTIDDAVLSLPIQAQKARAIITFKTSSTTTEMWQFVGDSVFTNKLYWKRFTDSRYEKRESFFFFGDNIDSRVLLDLQNKKVTIPAGGFCTVENKRRELTHNLTEITYTSDISLFFYNISDNSLTVKSTVDLLANDLLRDDNYSLFLIISRGYVMYSSCLCKDLPSEYYSGVFNIDKLVPKSSGFYALSEVLGVLPKETKIANSIISFKTSDSSSETWMFHGVAAFTNELYWKEIGRKEFESRNPFFQFGNQNEFVVINTTEKIVTIPASGFAMLGNKRVDLTHPEQQITYTDSISFFLYDIIKKSFIVKSSVDFNATDYLYSGNYAVFLIMSDRNIVYKGCNVFGTTNKDVYASLSSTGGGIPTFRGDNVLEFPNDTIIIYKGIRETIASSQKLALEFNTVGLIWYDYTTKVIGASKTTELKNSENKYIIGNYSTFEISRAIEGFNYKDKPNQNVYRSLLCNEAIMSHQNDVTLTDLPTTALGFAAEMNSLFDALEASNPTYISSEIIATDSITNIKRFDFNDETLIFGNQDFYGKKVKVFITTGQHGEEKQAQRVVANFFTQLCTNNNAFYTYLKRYIHFIVIPACNPWGNDNVTRKTESGVDLNSNYEVGWALSDPSSTTYGGTAPFTEDLSSAVRDILEANTDIRLYIDFHNYGVDTTSGDFDQLLWCDMQSDRLSPVCRNAFSDTFYSMTKKYPAIATYNGYAAAYRDTDERGKAAAYAAYATDDCSATVFEISAFPFMVDNAANREFWATNSYEAFANFIRVALLTL